jgi:hypothetical protein
MLYLLYKKKKNCRLASYILARYVLSFFRLDSSTLLGRRSRMRADAEAHVRAAVLTSGGLHGACSRGSIDVLPRVERSAHPAFRTGLPRDLPFFSDTRDDTAIHHRDIIQIGSGSRSTSWIITRRCTRTSRSREVHPAREGGGRPR